MLSNFLFSKPKNVANASLDRYIERLSSDYRPNVDLPSTECRLITDRYIGQVLVKYRPTVGEVSVNEKLYRPRHLERVSTDCRPSINRLSTAILTDCRPSVDRVSADCRPLYRPISQSTLPIVNKIQRGYTSEIQHSFMMGKAQSHPLKVCNHTRAQQQFYQYM